MSDYKKVLLSKDDERRMAELRGEVTTRLTEMVEILDRNLGRSSVIDDSTELFFRGHLNPEVSMDPLPVMEITDSQSAGIRDCVKAGGHVEGNCHSGMGESPCNIGCVNPKDGTSHQIN